MPGSYQVLIGSFISCYFPASLFKDGESVEFSGMAIAHLAADEDKLVKTGRILSTSHLAKEYGFVDLVCVILYNLFKN